MTGQCVDLPSEPEENGFRRRIKLRAYPLVERGGVLWTYMGPPEHQPGLPEFEFACVPPAHTFTSKRLQYSNWLQALEGGIDSSHVSFLHRDALHSDPLMQGSRGNQYNMGDAMRALRGRRSPGRPVHRRPAQGRAGQPTTGASRRGACRPSP